MKRQTIVMLFVGLAAALMAVPALAQQTFSKTITETQVNDAYRVDNPRRVALSNVVVDLQPGQVQISATHTGRRVSVDTITTLVPSIEDGRIYWDVVSVVTADGQAASSELVAQVNASIETSWANYVRGNYEGVVDSISITDTDLTVTGTFDGSRAEAASTAVTDAVEDGTVNEEDTPFIWKLFNWFNR
ncbi:MAG: hypothetical protein K8L99_10290 [Anaerolineae bacterium]|nr:hypothetical protein [Anaerolineae bacterium]